MNNEPEPQNSDSGQPPRVPVNSSAASPSANEWSDPYRGRNRPSMGVILGGVAMGLVGAPICGVAAVVFIGNLFRSDPGVIVVLVATLVSVWCWSGWLTAGFARTKGARIGLALLFGLGYGIFPFAVIFAICGGRFGG
jgi:hypothetical protein